MKKYFGKFASSGDVQTALDGLQLVNPYVAVVENDTMDYDSKEPDYTKMPLTFEILTGGTIKWEDTIRYGNPKEKTIQYRKNGGSWVSITSNTGASAPTISVNAGDIVQFKGDNGDYGHLYNYTHFTNSQDARFNIMGNAMSLISSTGYTSTTNLGGSAFANLLAGTGVVNAENMILPAIYLAILSYQNMFSDCRNLISAPVLAAATFDEYASGCYFGMFQGCTSLVKAPDLVTTTLNTNNLFYNTFNGCSSLNYVKCLAATITGNDVFHNWLDGVSATGTFVKKAGTTFPEGAIPNGWTVIEE